MQSMKRSAKAQNIVQILIFKEHIYKKIAKISLKKIFLNYLFSPDERSIVPPGTESSEPRSENTLSNSNTEGKPERTVIPPKRSYNSGPGQGHRGYINPYHQNNYRPSAPKKPFDFSRVGGTCSFLCIYL